MGLDWVMSIRTPFLWLVASMLLEGFGYTQASHLPGRHHCTYTAACVSGSFPKVEHAKGLGLLLLGVDQYSSHSEVWMLLKPWYMHTPWKILCSTLKFSLKSPQSKGTSHSGVFCKLLVECLFQLFLVSPHHTLGPGGQRWLSGQWYVELANFSSLWWQASN